MSHTDFQVGRISIRSDCVLQFDVLELFLFYLYSVYFFLNCPKVFFTLVTQWALMCYCGLFRPRLCSKSNWTLITNSIKFHKTSSKTSNHSKDFVSIPPSSGSKNPLYKYYAIKNERPTRWCHLFHVWSHDKNHIKLHIIHIIRCLVIRRSVLWFASKNIQKFEAFHFIFGFIIWTFRDYLLHDFINMKYLSKAKWKAFLTETNQQWNTLFKCFFWFSKVKMTNNCVFTSLIISCTIKYVYSFGIVTNRLDKQNFSSDEWICN